MLSIFNSNFFGSVCAFVEIIYLDFFTFKANLLILSQSLIFDNSLFILNIHHGQSERDKGRFTMDQSGMERKIHHGPIREGYLI